jgi:ABC-type transport system involved in cytochrome c biogenesis permease component
LVVFVGVRDGNLDVAVLGLPLWFPFLIAADSAGVASKVARALGVVSLCWWDEVVGLQAAGHFQRQLHWIGAILDE